MKVIVLQLETKREEELLKKVLDSLKNESTDEREVKKIEDILDYLSSEESEVTFVSKINESRIRKITILLSELGIPANKRGFQYIRECIMIMLDNQRELDIGITKYIYPKLSSKFNTSVGCIERNIRYAIEIAWERGNKNLIESVWGYSISTNKIRPTNSEFLARVTDYIKLNENEK